MDEHGIAYRNLSGEAVFNEGMKKILLVDDDLLSVEFMRMYVESKGYESLTANTVDSAKKLLDQHQPQVVVTDLQLSDGTGIEVADHAINLCSAVVIGVTGYDRQSLESRGISLAALTAILLKPLDLKLLDEALAAIPSN